jgi:hypothetical protein
MWNRLQSLFRLQCWFREHKYVARLVSDDRGELYKGDVCDRCGKLGHIYFQFK